jgi:hypothetical protein
MTKDNEQYAYGTHSECVCHRHCAPARLGGARFAAPNLQFYAYILADLTPTLETQCRLYGLLKTADGLGYFGYQQNYRTYLEVLSFDKVISDSQKRNAKPFEQLGPL